MAGEATDRIQRREMREEYAARINRVIDYVEANIDQNLSLAKLAEVANFSPYHFHRIFSALIGETLGRFIQRIRIERAANALVSNPRKSITEIAFDCGFSSSAAFARAFREGFGMSASEWRDGGCLDEGKINQADRKSRQTPGKIRKESKSSVDYVGGQQFTQTWRITMHGDNPLTAEIEVRDLPVTHTAYIRHIGPYAGDTKLFESLYDRLFKWAGPRGLLRFPETKVLSVYHDNPEITDEDKLRLDVCISVPEDTQVDGEVGLMSLAAGQYAIAHFEIRIDQFGEAWKAVFADWLPESGYQPADGPCFEHCLNDPSEHPQGLAIVDICVPVKPL
jgi:AraC family transcriptional regulator